MKISPIMYMGCKKDLIKKGLLNYFPNNIKTFYEPFGGSAIVSMNVNAEKYELSDINHHLIELYDLFKTKSSEEIIHYGHKIIEEYKLFSKSIDNRELDKYKDSFNKYRDYYNKYKNPMDLFVLSLFSFSQSIRFNNDDLYDGTIGNRSFSKNTEKNIFDGCKFFSQNNVNFYKRSFTDIDINILNENDFIYFDPPYTSTNTPYNKFWTEENDNQLFNICEKLNDKNIKWGISDVFQNRGNVNEHIINWCKKNNWTVIHFNKNYSFNGCSDSETDEVYICNYQVEKDIFDMI